MEALNDIEAIKSLRRSGWVVGVVSERTDMFTVSAKRGAQCVSCSASNLLDAVELTYLETISRMLSKGGVA